MAQKPRLKVTLSVSTYATIERLAELNGVSMSAIVGDMIESVAPGMQTTLSMLEAAQEASSSTKRDLVMAMDGIERELIGALGSSQAQAHYEIAKATHRQPNGSGGKKKGRKRPKSES